MTTPATTSIVYPDSDGMPLPDGEYQSPLFFAAVSTLRLFFRDVPGSRVNGDTFIYYVEGNPRIFFSPDCYVATDLSEESIESIVHRNVYLTWEVGKAPDFILEIGSPSTAQNDLGSKRDLYAELGVREYWKYDGTGGDFYGEPLVGERLVDGEYQRLEMRVEADGSVWSHSDALNLDLWWIDGELRFWNPLTEQWLLNHEREHLRAEEERRGRMAAESRADQEQARADEEQARADEEQARADEEQARAERAESRLAEMKAELQRLRGE